MGDYKNAHQRSARDVPNSNKLLSDDTKSYEQKWGTHTLLDVQKDYNSWKETTPFKA